MAAYISTELYQFTVFINHGDNGWSESFYLRDQDRVSALATAAELLEARSWVLGANCVIEWAEIKFCSNRRNVQAAITDPVSPLAMWGPPDNDRIGLYFRFQTGTGKYSKHVIRGVADDEITDNKWVRAPLSLPDGVFPRPVDPDLATKDDLWRYFLTLHRERCCHAEFLDNIPPFGDIWKLTPFAYVVYRHPSSLAYSSRYQRVSAEWVEWEQSADFSYCGTVCGVQRTCRQVDSYAYVNGPKFTLRFYFAAEDATVFPHPTIFFGNYRDKEITNSTAPGELTGPKKTLLNPSGVWQYALGWSAGAAPGVGPTGPASRFLGLDSIPFAPLPDTPEINRPGCDMPIGPLTIQDVDPNTVIVTNVTKIDLENEDFDVVEVVPGWVKIAAKAKLTMTLSGGTPTYSNVKEVILHRRDFELTQTLADTAEVKLREEWPTAIPISSLTTDLAIDADAKIVNLNVSVAAQITGIAGGRPGRRITLVNTGIAALELRAGGFGSLPANALNMPCVSWHLQPKNSIELIYDATTALWLIGAKLVPAFPLTPTSGKKLAYFDAGSPDAGWSLDQSPVEVRPELLFVERPFSFDTGPALVTGNELDPSTNRVVRFDGAAGQMINYITRNYPGRTLTIVNRTAGNLILKHNDTGIFPEGNIWGPGEVDYTLERFDSVDLVNALHTGLNAWFIVDRVNAGFGAAQMAQVLALI